MQTFIVLLNVVLMTSVLAAPDQPALGIDENNPAEGDDIKLTCTAAGTGDPVTEYEFFFGTTPLGAKGTATEHTITAITPAEDGNYTCKVYDANGDTADSASQTVTVKPKPTKPTLKGEDVSGDLKLTCTTTTTTAGVSYSFNKPAGASSGTVDATAGTYTKTTPASTDAGNYTCKATLDGVDSDLSDKVIVAVDSAGTLTITNPGNGAALAQVPVLLVTVLTVMTSLVLRI